MNKTKVKLLFGKILFVLTINFGYSPEPKFKISSLKTAIEIGINEGRREIGMGVVCTKTEPVSGQNSPKIKEKSQHQPNCLYKFLLRIGSFLTELGGQLCPNYPAYSQVKLLVKITILTSVLLQRFFWEHEIVETVETLY